MNECVEFILLTFKKFINLSENESTIYKPDTETKVADFTGIGVFLTIIYSNDIYNEFRINKDTITKVETGETMDLERFANELCLKKRMKKKMVLSFEIRLTNPRYDPDVEFPDEFPYHPLNIEYIGSIDREPFYVNHIYVRPTIYVYFRNLVSIDRKGWRFHNENVKHIDVKMGADVPYKEEYSSYTVINPNSGNYYPLMSSKGTKYILEGTKLLKEKDSEGFRDWNVLLKYVPYNKSDGAISNHSFAFISFVKTTYLSPKNPEWGLGDNLDIFNFEVEVIFKDNKAGIDRDFRMFFIPEFISEFKNRPDKRYGALLFGWSYKGDEHATLLLLDKFDWVYYHIDSNGDSRRENSVIRSILKNSDFKEESIYRFFKHGPQKKQITGAFPNFIGSCAIWVRYFICMIMINPEKSIEELMTYIMAKTSGQMVSLTRKFAEFSYRTIGSPYHDKLSIENVDEKMWETRMDKRL